MNRPTPPAVCALSIIASMSITALIVSVHAADIGMLGAREIAVDRTPALSRAHTRDAQPVASIALASTAGR